MYKRSCVFVSSKQLMVKSNENCSSVKITNIFCNRPKQSEYNKCHENYFIAIESFRIGQHLFVKQNKRSLTLSLPIAWKSIALERTNLFIHGYPIYVYVLVYWDSLLKMYMYNEIKNVYVFVLAAFVPENMEHLQANTGST